MNATIKAGSLPTNAFLGYPCTSFQVNIRKSLTVHLEDAGWFDVECMGDPNDDSSEPVWAGRYASFDDARAIAQGLNRVWVSCPQAKAADVLAIVRSATSTPEVA